MVNLKPQLSQRQQEGYSVKTRQRLTLVASELPRLAFNKQHLHSISPKRKLVVYSDSRHLHLLGLAALSDNNLSRHFLLKVAFLVKLQHKLVSSLKEECLERRVECNLKVNGDRQHSLSLQDFLDRRRHSDNHNNHSRFLLVALLERSNKVLERLDNRCRNKGVLPVLHSSSAKCQTSLSVLLDKPHRWELGCHRHQFTPSYSTTINL